MEYNIPYLCKNSKSFLINEIFIGMIILKYHPFTPQGDLIGIPHLLAFALSMWGRAGLYFVMIRYCPGGA